MSKVGPPSAVNTSAVRGATALPEERPAAAPAVAEQKPSWLAKANASRPVEMITAAMTERNAWSELADSAAARTAKGEARPTSTTDQIFTTYKEAAKALQQLEKEFPTAFAVLTGNAGSAMDQAYGAPTSNPAQSVMEIAKILETGTPEQRAQLEAGLGSMLNSSEDLERGLNAIPFARPGMMTQALVMDLGLKDKLTGEQLTTIENALTEQLKKTAMAVEKLSNHIDKVGVAEFMQAAVGEFTNSTKTLQALKAALETR